MNTYQVFAGLVRQLVSGCGRVGVVLPTGITTDYYNQDYFSALVSEGVLASLYDFENRQGLFPGVHRSFKFSLLTLTGPEAPVKAADYAFFLHQVDELADPERHFALTAEDLRRINPNTGTCPVFRTRRDAELTAKLYRAAPVLVNEATGENPWGVSYMRMFDMTNDSRLFRTQEQLEAEGYTLDGNRFMGEDEVYLPLYEAKMFWHFDHRFGTYEGVENQSDVHLPTPSYEQLAAPDFVVLPRYWVPEAETVLRLKPQPQWLVAFRDISNSTNERTGVFALLPWTALSNKAPALLPENSSALRVCGFLANLNAMVFDYVIRQKMGGTSLNLFIVKQFPVLPPDTYTRPLTHYGGHLTDYIVPRVLELTYTAWDLRPFADDVWAEAGESGREVERERGRTPLQAALLRQWEENQRAVAASPAGAGSQASPHATGFPYPPFTWDEERRAQLRAELDALYAHLYGLTREELEYVMETFPIVKRRDEERYGEYRTKRMVVEGFEALSH